MRNRLVLEIEMRYIPVTCNKILLSQLCVGMYHMTVASPELSRQQSKEPQLLPVCQSVCTRTLVHLFSDSSPKQLSNKPKSRRTDKLFYLALI